jgi:hypothetical protein
MKTKTGNKNYHDTFGSLCRLSDSIRFVLAHGPRPATQSTPPTPMSRPVADEEGRRGRTTSGIVSPNAVIMTAPLCSGAGAFPSAFSLERKNRTKEGFCVTASTTILFVDAKTWCWQDLLWSVLGYSPCLPPATAHRRFDIVGGFGQGKATKRSSGETKRHDKTWLGPLLLAG